MKVEYSLDENDFLIHQLYIASKSKRIKQKRLRSRLMVPVIYTLFSVLFFQQNKFELMTIFLLIAALWFLIYPSWEKKRYIKHYQNFIKENYKARIGRISSLTLNNDCFLTKDDGGESKILTSETEEIIEISKLILIRLKSGQSLLIPKSKVDQLQSVIDFLKSMSTTLKINYVVESDWKWK